MPPADRSCRTSSMVARAPRRFAAAMWRRAAAEREDVTRTQTALIEFARAKDRCEKARVARCRSAAPSVEAQFANCVPSKVANQHRQIDFESSREPHQNVQARSLLTSFEIPDVVECDARYFS